MCVNEDYHAKVSPAKVVKLLEAYKQEAMAAAPQG
jgi:NADH:ubiquinone oxidoreductase subunit E